MRIAFVAHDVNQWAGTPRVAAALIERFCDDHEVSVFSHTIEGINMSKIKHHKVPAAPRTRTLNYLSFLICSTIILALWRFLRRRNFDIIHCSTGYDCLFSPNVFTSHFCEREGYRLEKVGTTIRPAGTMLRKLKILDYSIYRRLAAFIEKLTFGGKSSKARIVVSERMKEDFHRHYGDAAEDIIVIPNGTDCHRFNPANRRLYRDSVRQRHGISSGDFVLLFVGGDWERKGLYYLIEALSLILRPEVKLLVVGRGDTDFYVRLATEKAVGERVTFVPHTHSVWEYYGASDVFVLPALYEPFGLVIGEAMACGLPVIAAKVAGAADFIIDGVNGLLLNNPRNADDLAAKISLLLLDVRLREMIGKRARITAEKISWDEVAKRTLEAYTKVTLQRKK
ncbi:D-inositol-3-phosphate glycosyltransferase [subsurface metagenome]